MSPRPPAVTLTEPTDASIKLTVYEYVPAIDGDNYASIVLNNRGALALAEQLQRAVRLGKDFRLFGPDERVNG